VRKEGAITENIFQICRFAIVGGLNTLVDWAVYFVIVGLYPVESVIFYTIAKGISYLCGMINSYLLNRSWTFKGSRAANEVRRLIRFLLVNTVSLGINSLSIYIFLNLNLAHITSLFFATAITFSINFTLNKLWVFRENKMMAKVTRG
jgi:putative flippase GtrA